MEKIEKVLQLYYKDGGINDAPFPSSEDQIEIGAFRYNATRMGGAPTITATVMYPICLDDVWTDSVYAKFNGEKYYLKQTPTSSYDNVDVMYRHEVTLVSERAVLDNVYFFDVVTGNPSESNKPVSNSTKVTFFGGIRDFASRLNASLEYSGLDYEVVVDDEITKEEKLMSFEDQFFSSVLQEIYNTYEAPYYFEGKTIHIGYAKDSSVIPTFSYGVDDALISISKNNANYKIVNRATGTGSSENIPFYYPNNSPKGNIVAEESEDSQLGVEIFDYELFADKVAIDGVITYQAAEADITKVIDSLGNLVSSGNNSLIAEFGYKGYSTKYKMYITSYIDGVIPLTLTPLLDFTRYDNKEDTEGSTARGTTSIRIFSEGKQLGKSEVNSLGHTFDITLPRGMSLLEIHVSFTPEYNSSTNWFEGSVGLSWATDSIEGWYYEGEEVVLKDLGLSITKEYPYTGDSITLRQTNYVKTSQNLMPSIYRQSGGKERFYNAVNYPYSKPEGFEINKVYLGADGYWRNEIGEYEIEGIIHNDAYKNEDGTYIHFDHPYVEGKAKEHIVVVEDLKPTIKKAVNSRGLRMDMFSEFAYDDDDNEETEENEDGSDRDFVHSYFFGKLRKLDFNLFDCAIEQQPMTISFTSGACGACNFEIGVTEEFPQRNPVMVNPDGTLMRDANGRVVCGQFAPIYENDLQPEQQDTSKYEVWIALKKDEETYGELMPKAPVDGVGGHRPKAARNEDGTPNNEGDTFVILGINLPEEYVIRQERQLEKDIIKYIKDNNEEKFTFSINFSRIYFEENSAILDTLNENSKIRITYNSIPYDLYVSSFSYTLDEGDVLPEIRVELDDTLKIGQNPIQKAVNQVKSELGNALRNIDVVGAGTPYFLRKDVDDEVIGRVNFRKGVKFGEGGKVEVLDNNSAKLTIEYLEVTKKASFTSLEIQEKTHVGGQLLVTPAAINCGEVEEFDDFYRCYFQTKGVEGDEIFNQFAMDDQAICQTYNTWGSRYYWRKVVGIGEDYIDLSKVEGEYDEDSDIPMAGDKIIQLGNQSDATRQNAIVIAAYGDGSPYIIQYKGIDNFELTKDKITTKLASDENIFTGKVHMELGSDGFENIYGELNIGGQNMLRNSGFTGDYLSEPIADDNVLEAASKLFNDPFIHWFVDESISPKETVSVEEIEDSTSGYGIRIDSSDNGSLVYQNLYHELIKYETYTISFKAIADVNASVISVACGGVSTDIEVENVWKRYSAKIVVKENDKYFGIKGNACSICEIQLERGTVATAWNPSYLDNSSDRTYYEAQKYVADALKGSTTVAGGLILTNQIQLGSESNQSDFIEKAGANGRYINDNSPAFYAGGDLDKAIDTAMKYETDGETPEDEIAFVVTHGGKMILNDAVVRGKVYAKEGEFTGVVHATSGDFEGEVIANGGKIGDFDIAEVDGGVFLKSEGDRENESTEMTLSGYGLQLHSEGGKGESGEPAYRAQATCYPTRQYAAIIRNTFTDTSSDDSTLPTECVALRVRAEGAKTNDNTQSGGNYAIYNEYGMIGGLRPRVIGVNISSITLSSIDHTVLVVSSCSITLPREPQNGQEYEIICPNTSLGAVTITSATKKIYLMLDGIERNSFSVGDLGGARQVVKLVYFECDGKWFVWHHTY